MKIDNMYLNLMHPSSQNYNNVATTKVVNLCCFYTVLEINSAAVYGFRFVFCL